MPLSQETRDRMRNSHADVNGSTTRYRIICRHIANGEPLCPKDYAFYIYYCNTRGIAIGKVHIGKSAKPLGFTAESPLRGEDRYKAIMSCKDRNEPISSADYAFLCKYCKRHHIATPRLRAEYMWEQV